MRLAPCQLVETYGPKIRTVGPGKNWYQRVTFGYHDGAEFVRLPGFFQISYIGRCHDYFTMNNKRASVRGLNLAWLIREAGYEVMTDSEYWWHREQAASLVSHARGQLAYHLNEE